MPRTWLSAILNRHLIGWAAIAVVLGAGFGIERLTSGPYPEDATDPASRRMEYRPGGYFPEGFPLHGTVRLLTPPVVEMGKRERIRIEYTVGERAIESGEAIEIWKHFTSDAEEFQVTDPSAPAHFSAETTAAGVRFRPVAFTNWAQRNTPSVFPYRKCAGLVIEQGQLSQGDKVLFDLGGEQGVRMQHYAENLFNFRVVITRDGNPDRYGGDAAMSVTGGPLRRLRVQAPSIVTAGERFAVEVVPTDEWISLAKDHTGLAFRVTGGGVSPGKFAYDPKLSHYVARDFVAQNPGAVLRIKVETADGRFSGVSNPIWVERNPVRRVYFGELHQHTYLHDGRGVFEELYMYGRSVGLLDFAALSPHHIPLSVSGPAFHLKEQWPTDQWPELQRATKLMNGWEGLVSILGYEYSVGTNKGGHHNIYYNADTAKSTMELDPKDPSADIGKMLCTLQFARVPTLVIPHIGGGPPDWSHPPDDRVERLFEVASVHGVFEEPWQKHLEAGLRQGAIGAGDTHTTAMGNSYPGLIYGMTNGLAGVYAFGKSRDEIWDGMHERRTFAVTGAQRMLVGFEVNGEPMGGEISSKLHREAHVRARVSGTAPLLRLDLLRNSKVIHTVRPARGQGKLVRVTWGDNIYQRRAAIGRAPGKLTVDGGRFRLAEPVHRDQAFETFSQPDERTILWNTASNSGDRDGILVDLTGASGVLHLEVNDEAAFPPIRVDVPVEKLLAEGFVRQVIGTDQVKHPYMDQMKLAPAYTVEFELVNDEGPMDASLEYRDREPLQPGDYYYIRVQQLDTNLAWSSPVWVN